MNLSHPGNEVLFSIIIPARNEERNIGRCLESIAAVDWPAGQLEVLVVDNGSSDRTAEIAQGMGAQVLLRPGATVAGLRNFGASLSRGPILVFLDADCTVHPDWLQNACRHLPEQGISCFGSPPVVPPESTWVQRAWFHIRRKKGCFDTDWLESMNMFVRSDAFAEVGGFDEDLVTCEDYDLSLRLRRFGRIVSDDRIVAVHHGEAASVGHFFRKEHWRALGNLRGMRSHPFHWRELPSLLLPLIYCLLALVTLAALLALPFSTLPWPAYLLVGLLLAWQLPLYLLAFWKISPKGMLAALQLYLLMNVYFFARGLASLRFR